MLFFLEQKLCDQQKKCLKNCSAVDVVLINWKLLLISCLEDNGSTASHQYKVTSTSHQYNRAASIGKLCPPTVKIPHRMLIIYQMRLRHRCIAQCETYVNKCSGVKNFVCCQTSYAEHKIHKLFTCEKCNPTKVFKNNPLKWAVHTQSSKIQLQHFVTSIISATRPSYFRLGFHSGHVLVGQWSGIGDYIHVFYVDAVFIINRIF